MSKPSKKVAETSMARSRQRYGVMRSASTSIATDRG
jgi:hypothetical protein